MNPLRILFAALGCFFVVVGIVGIFVPLLPTTPFLLLASACFARSSARLHNWLRTHRTFGRLLRDWEDGRGIPLRAKILAIAMMWPSMIYSMFRVGHPALKGMLFVIACGVTIYLWRLPTSRR
jgi:uncharacterized membrane protein YbaN (DUF454 family)